MKSEKKASAVLTWKVNFVICAIALLVMCADGIEETGNILGALVFSIIGSAIFTILFVIGTWFTKKYFPEMAKKITAIIDEDC